MKNKTLRNKIMILVIVMVFMIPLQPLSFATTSLDNDISAIAKKPIGKKEIGFRFLMAMLGVAASSVVIYVGLSAYNKIFNGTSKNVVGLNSFNKKNDNHKQALKIFLEKTDWD